MSFIGSILLFSSSASLLYARRRFFCKKKLARTCPFVFEG